MKVINLALICPIAILAGLQCLAGSSDAMADDISRQVLAELYPAATSILSSETTVPHQLALHGNEILGYSFHTDLIAPIPAYSGFPIRSLVNMSKEGVILDVRIISHQEPILVIGIDEKTLTRFIRQYTGMSVKEDIRIRGAGKPNSIDGISGATITAMVLNRTIVKSAQKVLAAQPTSRVAITSLAEKNPYWLEAWQDKTTELAILFPGLFILVMILLLQDQITKHPRFLNGLRLAFLVYTITFIGYYCLAQLSIINVVTFIRLLITHSNWDALLLDPVVFVLWSFVALTILLWGRGIFCGWLCPFGAIQELMSKLADKIHIEPRTFPPAVHERLLVIKYLILVALVVLSLNSVATAAPFLEIEPFKTSINFKFQREWYYSIYAIGLIAASLFASKFYCRYICPLGALLSFISRIRIFRWLRRRPECGSICHTCGNDCRIGAINISGEIDESECHYCLACQTTYWDEHHCPVMIEDRIRRERQKNLANVIPARNLLE